MSLPSYPLNAPLQHHPSGILAPDHHQSPVPIRSECTLGAPRANEANVSSYVVPVHSGPAFDHASPSVSTSPAVVCTATAPFSSGRSPQSSNDALPRACSIAKEEKEATLFRFLQECEATCMLHNVVNGSATHKLFSCEAWQTFRLSYHSFRSQIRFTARGICYRCCVPTSQQFDHPFRSKNDDPPCRFDDILKPLSLLVYCIPPLKDVVMDQAGVGPNFFHSSQNYAKWLGEVRPGCNALPSNLLEVCHAYIYMLVHNRLVSVPRCL